MEYYIEHEVTCGALQGEKFVLDNDGELVKKTKDKSNLYTTDMKNAEFIASVLNGVDSMYGTYEAKPIEEYDDYINYFKDDINGYAHYTQWLTEEVLDKIIRNVCNAEYKYDVDAEVFNILLESSNVDCLFEWETTDEGCEYWHSLSKAITKKRQNLKIT
jgi:hypothetical protein